MTPTDFEMRILRQHWVKDDGKEDANDLCSHGEVFIRIGSEVLSNEASGSWTLSTAGLFLMRSLEQDCELQEYSNALVPCCGHSLYAFEDDENLLVIPGCKAGVDWEVRHIGEDIELVTESGTKAQIPFNSYKRRVLTFADEVGNFYGEPNRKTVPNDELDAKGFALFWNEWTALKHRWV